MRTWTALTTATVIGAATTGRVHGWWDNGHMLVGEVAAQLMSSHDLYTIGSVLTDWEREFPNTNTIATAAIWPDLIKCSKTSTSCTTKTLPSIGAMSEWHYVDLPLNANGTQWGNAEPDLDLFKSSFGGDAENVLESFMETFNTTQSLWAANLALRQLIHILGDIHQPLHAVTAVSEEFPTGDQGGNKYVFPDGCAFRNLHAMFDAAGGEYVTNWALHMTLPHWRALVSNATELMKELNDIDDGNDITKYEKLSYSDFAHAIIDNSMFEKFALESYVLSTDFVYPELDKTFDAKGKIPCPSETYTAEVTAKSKKRIALAGKRLSVVLAKIAQQLRSLSLAF